MSNTLLALSEPLVWRGSPLFAVLEFHRNNPYGPWEARMYIPVSIIGGARLDIFVYTRAAKNSQKIDNGNSWGQAWGLVWSFITEIPCCCPASSPDSHDTREPQKACLRTMTQSTM